MEKLNWRSKKELKIICAKSYVSHRPQNDLQSPASSFWGEAVETVESVFVPGRVHKPWFKACSGSLMTSSMCHGNRWWRAASKSPSVPGLCVREGASQPTSDWVYSSFKFRVNPPLDRPAVFTNRRWAHDTRDLVRKPDELLEDGMTSAFVCNNWPSRYPCSSFRAWSTLNFLSGNKSHQRDGWMNT